MCLHHVDGVRCLHESWRRCWQWGNALSSAICLSTYGERQAVWFSFNPRSCTRWREFGTRASAMSASSHWVCQQFRISLEWLRGGKPRNAWLCYSPHRTCTWTEFWLHEAPLSLQCVQSQRVTSDLFRTETRWNSRLRTVPRQQWDRVLGWTQTREILDQD